MKTTRTIAISAILVGSGLVIQAVHAQLGGTRRTDLQRHDLSATGREVVQVRVEIAPGVTAAKHSHPGEEIVYVLAGSLEYRLDGQPPKVVQAGEVLFIPYGVNHEVKNVGTVNASELATYIVEKGKPLVTQAQ
jgi:quercetin dioxygenase-like cupin family protein